VSGDARVVTADREFFKTKAPDHSAGSLFWGKFIDIGTDSASTCPRRVKLITMGIRDLLSEFRANNSDQLHTVCDLAARLLQACRTIQRAWSGSFAGWHGNVYFRDFNPPSVHQRFSGEWGGVHGIPEGWVERQPEEVQAKIEELVGNGLSIKQFEETLHKLRKDALRMKEEIVIHLDPLDSSGPSTREKELTERIEKYGFGKTTAQFVSEGLPKTLVSRDSEALRQGTCVPSWLYYEGVALEGRSLCETIEEFFQLGDRLVRVIDAKKKGGKMTSPPEPLGSLHRDIKAKCHDLYAKNAYAEAVEKGFKVVRDRLRQLTGYETGSEAFGKGKMHIKGATATHVDTDFNDAVKFLTMAIDRFRNEKSHTSDAKIDDPNRAYEYLRLSSLAMNLLENAEILP
jgi:uncharacterized protein (TIGR02391 family)